MTMKTTNLNINTKEKNFFAFPCEETEHDFAIPNNRSGEDPPIAPQ